MKNSLNVRGIIICVMIMVLLVLGLVLTGCATSVPINSVRKPTIDTTNIQRLALRSFENKSGGGGYNATQIIQYLNDSTQRQIMSSGNFTIVAVNDPNAEGIFTGEIRNIVSKESQEQRQWKDKEGKTHSETIYRRDVELEFQYSVISTRTSMPVGFVIKRGSQSSSSNDRSRLSDVVTLARSIIDSQLRQFQRDIVPTIVSNHVQLMSETSKDKVVKQRMKVALVFVKNRDYEEAIRQYDEISSEYNSGAARTNAGILRRAIQSDIDSRSELAALMNDTGGLVGKAVTGVIESLNSTLPSGSNIIIMKTNSSNRNMLDNAVDQITRNVVGAGRFKVVDRQNTALVNAEAAYQLSGNVSDNSIVQIGHQLGAQYIILCWISGEMSARRLNVRILSVETSHIFDQKDFEI